MPTASAPARHASAGTSPRPHAMSSNRSPGARRSNSMARATRGRGVNSPRARSASFAESVHADDIQSESYVCRSTGGRDMSVLRSERMRQKGRWAGTWFDSLRTMARQTLGRNQWWRPSDIIIAPYRQRRLVACLATSSTPSTNRPACPLY